MTSTVKITAHCSKDKEVQVKVTDKGNTVEEFAVQDGESAERHIYDDREVSAKEVVKPQ